MMQTRCPECRTVFVVTPEQLRMRAGKVRCGRCQAVFNAFDQLLVDTPQAQPAPDPVPSPAPVVAESGPPEPAAHDDQADLPRVPPVQEAAAEAASVADFVSPQASTAAVAAPMAAADDASAMPAEVVQPKPVAVAGRTAETTAASVEAVRAAGLAAARELSEAPGYNRWAAGVLAGDGSAGFAIAAERPLRWPYILASLLLATVLGAQLLYHYRVEAVARLPQLRVLAEMLGVEVGLPRDSAQVSIESSDLQVDTARGLLLLQAQLRNRAAFAQDWPHLELTLTDADDRPLARRVLAASDYLPPGGAAAFPPASDVPVRMWIEPQGVTAAGYRLYVFYP